MPPVVRRLLARPAPLRALFFVPALALGLVVVLALAVSHPAPAAAAVAATSGAGGAEAAARPAGCLARRTAALVERMAATGADGRPVAEVPQHLFVAPAGSGGSYAGLVVGRSGWRSLVPPAGAGLDPGPEHQLAFEVHLGGGDLLPNPERPPLPRATLVRDRAATTAVAPGSPFEVHLHLDPTSWPATGGAVQPFAPGLLAIDNLARPVGPAADASAATGGPRARQRPGRLADSGPGRGLVEAGLDLPCDERVDRREQRVLAILARTLRPRLVDEIAGRVYDTRVALLPGEVPELFVAVVRLVDPASGRLLPGRIEVEVVVGPGTGGDLLGAGQIRLAGRSGAGSSVRGTIEIVQPTFAGLARAVGTVAALSVDPAIVAAAELFDWHQVLEASAWNRPPAVVPPSSGAGGGPG